VDRGKTLKQGVTLSDVYVTLQTSLGGLFVNQFNRFGRQWRVFVEAEAEDRASVGAISQYYVRDRAGTMVPLNTLVSTKPTNGPDFTTRFNLYRAAQIIGSSARIQLRSSASGSRRSGQGNAPGEHGLRLGRPFLSGT
jgi:HAE1 family hydrophobic/amphiphilic exporter-1